MNNLDLLDDVDDNTGLKIVKFLGRHWGWALLVLAILVATLFFQLWRLSVNKQDELAQQVEQQNQQLERQNQLINALNEKGNDTTSHETVPIVTSDTIKQQLNSIQELVTQQYIYTNADKKESSETWLWGVERPFSGKSILITYDGTIKAGVDLSQIDIIVDEENRIITVTLPPSKITDNNIPQESINVVEVKNGLFNEVTFDNYNEFISEQKLIMEQKAISQGLLTQADEEARSIVEAVLSVIPGIGTGEGEYRLIVS